MRQKIFNVLLMVFVLTAMFGMKTDAAEVQVKTEIQEVLERTEISMFAAEEEEIELVAYGYCGEPEVIWGLTTDGILVIAGEGTMWDYEDDWYSAPWFKYNDDIYAVVISGTVNNIGEYAFYWCQDLLLAVIETGVEKIGTGAFLDCESLESVIIEEGLTKIENYAFENCYKLQYIEMPSTVTTIGKCAFISCISLQEIELSSGLKGIEEGVFVGCYGLQSINIPNGVTQIGARAFSACSSLASIEIPETVTSIGQAAFANCTALESFTFPASVKVIAPETFYGCSGLEMINIPTGVISIGREAFSKCDALKKISLPDTINQMENKAFFRCMNLREVVLSDNLMVIPQSAFEECMRLTYVTMPKYLEVISDYAFAKCNSLKTVIIPDRVKTIKDYAFLRCENLETVRIPASVTYAGYAAFGYCANLHKVTVLTPNMTFDSHVFRESSNVLIRCLENSTAQKYAVTFGHNYEFIDVSLVTEYFADVAETAWYKDSVQYVFDKGLMSGNGDYFNPTKNMTRAQLVTTLYNLAGKPKVSDYSACQKFADVVTDQYYTDAVCWAYNEGITSGSNGKFNPTASLTRQQLATFFYNYANYAGMNTEVRGDYSHLEGAKEVADYAKDTMEWAYGAGLITGSASKDETGATIYRLNPTGTATRAQLASILQRFCENYNI